MIRSELRTRFADQYVSKADGLCAREEMLWGAGRRVNGALG